MKTLKLTALVALAAVAVFVSAPARAEVPAWAAIASKPVPSYQPFRGYNGSPTYIGQNYTTPRNNTSFSPVEAPMGGGNKDRKSPLHELVEKSPTWIATRSLLSTLRDSSPFFCVRLFPGARGRKYEPCRISPAGLFWVWQSSQRRL